jgi:hypothetical protein
MAVTQDVASKREINKIQFVCEEKSQDVIDDYNQDKTPSDIIPQLNRNGASGWPLLQVSLLSPVFDEGEISYTPALGGGKCHFGFIAAFQLAVLMSKMPGRVETSDGFNSHAVKAMMGEFTVTNKRLGMSIKQEIGAYGKMLNIDLPLDNIDANRALTTVFTDMRSVPFLHDKTMYMIDGWKGTTHSQEQIEDNLDSQIAIFHDGQIFVDFGQLLENSVKNDEVKAYFSNIFKVNEYLEFTKGKGTELDADDATSDIEDAHAAALAESGILTERYTDTPQSRLSGAELLNSESEEKPTQKHRRFRFFNVFKISHRRVQQPNALDFRV